MNEETIEREYSLCFMTKLHRGSDTTQCNEVAIQNKTALDRTLTLTNVSKRRQNEIVFHLVFIKVNDILLLARIMLRTKTVPDSLRYV